MKTTKNYLLILSVIIVAITLSACTATQNQASLDKDADKSAVEQTPPADNKDKLTGDSEGEKKTEKIEETVKPFDDTSLDLSNLGLTGFPVYILEMTQLKKLDLSGNKLKTLPAEIGDLTNLEELYLNNNMLDGALPAEIRKMSKLKILDASNNNLTGIPAEIGQLNNLRELDYSNNKLDTYPNEIVNLKNLQKLDLTNNAYSPETLEAIQVLLPQADVIY